MRYPPVTSLRAALAAVRALPDAAPLGCRRLPRVSSAPLLGSQLSRRSLHQWPNPVFPALPPLLWSATTSPAACQLASHEAGQLLTHHGLRVLQDDERGSFCILPPQHRPRPHPSCRRAGALLTLIKSLNPRPLRGSLTNTGFFIVVCAHLPTQHTRPKPCPTLRHAPCILITSPNVRITLPPFPHSGCRSPPPCLCPC